MAYQTEAILLVLERKNIDTSSLNCLKPNKVFSKNELVTSWFGELGWSASLILEIFKDLDSENGGENMFGDGI